jgi:hypothetical protein
MKTASTKTASTKTCLVTVAKKGNDASILDAALAPSMTREDVSAAGGVMSTLALNFLAGTVHADVRTACEKSVSVGFPNMSNADKQAMRVLLPLTPVALRKAWATYVAGLKALRGVSLQALAKASKGKTATPTASFKDLVIEWALANDSAFAKLPVGLFDLIIAVMPEEKKV